jgi:hypothetical protein
MTNIYQAMDIGFIKSAEAFAGTYKIRATGFTQARHHV